MGVLEAVILIIVLIVLWALVPLPGWVLAVIVLLVLLGLLLRARGRGV